MNIAALKDSKFLKKEDCGQGILVTVKGVEEINVAKEGAPVEFKWCLWLNECDKPMVLNSTNGQIIAAITGSDDTDHWTGHKIVLYNDPNITFGGKLTGGIRARAPKNQPAKPAPAPTPAPVQARPVHIAATPAPAPAFEDDDSVPF